MNKFAHPTRIYGPSCGATIGLPPPHAQLREESDEESDRDIGFAAAVLAEQEGLPLLADDRVCQTLILNQRRNHASAAFGTDTLLLSLNRAGVIGDDVLAEKFLSLLKWRYRFLLPTPSILRTLLESHMEYPPGEKLSFVARYAHDCMRDAGLFGGLEQTEPPIPMAFRLYQDWVRVIIDFITDLWVDASVPEYHAEQVTDWAIRYFLPTEPKAMGNRAFRLSGMLVGTVFTFAMIGLVPPGIMQERINAYWRLQMHLGFPRMSICGR